MITYWIFKDPNNGLARLTSTDPGSLLTGLAETRIEAQDGLLLDTAVSQLNALKKQMEGVQGDETYIRIALGAPAS